MLFVREGIRSLRGLSDWRLWAAGFVTAVGIAAVEAANTWYLQGGHGRAIVKLTIYWAMWLAWPAAALLLLRAVAQVARGRIVGALLSVLALACVGGLIWSRFIEPNQLRVVETPVGTACGVRVALVADMHTGLYGTQPQLERLVNRLNTLDVDAVLVAGDWTYEPKHDLRRELAPFASLKHPAYAVLGNHDEQAPGPPVQEALRETLAALRVQNVEGKRVTLGRCELVGLGDLSAGLVERDVAELKKQRSAKTGAQRIVLTHEPDTVFHIDRGYASIVLAGHTHGGQINLPWFTERLMDRISEGGFIGGLYDTPNGKVFVNIGTGMVKLPFRFRAVPTVDVLSL
jgi:predicted MPP superfamily phosphohydrolase